MKMIYDHGGRPLLTREALEREFESLRRELAAQKAELARLELERAMEDGTRMREVLNDRREVIATRLEQLVRDGAITPAQRELFKKAHDYGNDNLFFTATHDPERWANMLALLESFWEQHAHNTARKLLIKQNGGDK